MILPPAFRAGAAPAARKSEKKATAKPKRKAPTREGNLEKLSGGKRCGRFLFYACAQGFGALGVGLDLGLG